MEINVTGRKIKVGAAFSSHVRARLEQASEKYFFRSTEASVTATKEAHLFSVACTIHAGHGLRLQSHGDGSDIYAAFDEAADRIEKQLRRYKRRIKNHHIAGLKDRSTVPAHSYVLGSEEESQMSDGGADPVVIAETTTEIRDLSVGDAVMHMDLSGSPAMMFRNPMSGELNVIYRRSDGNIGWIEPKPKAG